jgi:hypothetical protein
MQHSRGCGGNKHPGLSGIGQIGRWWTCQGGNSRCAVLVQITHARKLIGRSSAAPTKVSGGDFGLSSTGLRAPCLAVCLVLGSTYSLLWRYIERGRARPRFSGKFVAPPGRSLKEITRVREPGKVVRGDLTSLPASLESAASLADVAGKNCRCDASNIQRRGPVPKEHRTCPTLPSRPPSRKPKPA